MNRIIEDIYFLADYLTDVSPVKRRKSKARLQQYFNGERVHLTEYVEQCFMNPTIEMEEDDRA